MSQVEMVAVTVAVGGTAAEMAEDEVRSAFAALVERGLLVEVEGGYRLQEEFAQAVQTCLQPEHSVTIVTGQGDAQHQVAFFTDDGVTVVMGSGADDTVVLTTLPDDAWRDALADALFDGTGATDLRVFCAVAWSDPSGDVRGGELLFEDRGADGLFSLDWTGGVLQADAMPSLMARPASRDALWEELLSYLPPGVGTTPSKGRQ